MIEIEDKIVSTDIFKEYFSCDICSCKGACCIEGDSGAPLQMNEIDVIEENIEAIKKYMTPLGVDAIEKDGIFVVDSDGDYTTTLINGAECAYTLVENGVMLCAIERAYLSGEISFRKPISCHLYPIRTAGFSNGTTGLNYDRWSICEGAIKKGQRDKIKVYEGLKEPIIRAFGDTFYTYLEDVDRILISEKE